MQTHDDRDSFDNNARFMKRLEERAAEMKGKSKITAGDEGEHPLLAVELKGFSVRQMPPDEQGILRISIGGGQTPVPLNYVTFRGNRGACIDLLRKALQALYEVDK